MKKLLIGLLCAFLCVCMLSACGKGKEEEETIANDEAIFGTWTESYWDSGYSFAEDGTGMDIFWDQPFTYTAIDGELIIQYTEGIYQDKKFSYSISENTLTLTKSGEDGGTWEYYMS